jgi:hypothetical protein
MSQQQTFHIPASTAASNPANQVTNIFNKDPNTYYSAKGLESFIELELDGKEEYNTLSISFYRGDERRTKFTVEKLTEDGKYLPLKPHIFVSSGQTNNAEKYYFESFKAVRLRITFKGNLDNSQIGYGNIIKQKYIQELVHAYRNHKLFAGQDQGENKHFFSIRFLYLSKEDNIPKIDLDKHYEKVAKEFPFIFNKYTDSFDYSTQSEKPVEETKPNESKEFKVAEEEAENQKVKDEKKVGEPKQEKEDEVVKEEKKGSVQEAPKQDEVFVNDHPGNNIDSPLSADSDEEKESDNSDSSNNDSLEGVLKDVNIEGSVDISKKKGKKK